MPSISKSIKVKNCRSFIAEERVLVQVYKIKKTKTEMNAKLNLKDMAIK